MGGWVYMLASKRNGTLYLGVTSDLVARIWQHREGVVPGFTRDYGVKMLVWFEEHGRIEAAIQREHTMKHWSRNWKIALIERSNPEWRDLWSDINAPTAR
jgi:putative endonuclease